ncbi:MAG: hypothetical protein ACRDK7_04640 [Solirubrobacteraceae bacterium]
MADRPEELELVDRYLGAARYAHEYAFRVHRRLVELDADGDHTRKLLAESAAITLQQMPALVRGWRTLEREWSEQELLDPPKAEHTARVLEVRFTDLGPEIEALRVRQDKIVTELNDLLGDAKRA